MLVILFWHSLDCVEIKTFQNYDLTNGESVTIGLGIRLGRSESAAEVNHNDRIPPKQLSRQAFEFFGGKETREIITKSHQS